MKRFALLLSALLIIASPAVAQNAPETATLTAEGTGLVTTTPDIVIVTIGVTTRGESPTAALAENNAEMRSVIEAVTAAGIEDRDITTSGFSISPIYADRRTIDDDDLQPITGFSVSNQVTVRIRDIAASGDILDQVVAAGANQINSIRFSVAETEALRDEAVAMAIADARRKAELMAEAAGVELVRILSVSSYGGGLPQPELSLARNSVPIVAGEQAITANATIVFEIAPQ